MKRKIGMMLVCLIAACGQAQSWLQKKEQGTEKAKGWLENFEQAKQEAATHKQPIFAFFTGSDWCGWCVRLRKEVLDQKDFLAFAEKNLILFEADFPRGKRQSDAVKKQNGELAGQYGIRGYPTVVLLDAQGKALGRTGYQEGGAEAYVRHLKELLDKAGVPVGDKPDAGKTLTPYEKMKSGQRAQNAERGTKP
ncbi:MAG: thioredoxin family protein [Kiritimatiellia bacterium]|jgi:protein disulfide-isomerase|nr:thioredoxin family protein [Kiritimatiellia bacterium]